MAAEPTVPGSPGIREQTTPLQDLAEACIHLDAAVVAQRASAENLNESWSVLRRHLAERVLMLIAVEPSFRLNDRMLEALDTHFAENALISEAVRIGWCAATRGQIIEHEGHTGILEAIHKACTR